MLHDLRNEVSAFVERVDVPEPNVAAIQARMRAQSELRKPATLRRLAPLAAAAAVVAVLLGNPVLTRGMVQTIEMRVAQILHWTPPPAAPQRVLANAHPQTVTLAQARSLVPFALREPAGLPEVTSAKIVVETTPIYSRSAKRWESGTPAVIFSYVRPNGSKFELTAWKMDPGNVPSRYMFEETGTRADGMPILKRHERYVWRNGDQMMTAIAGDGVTASEIAAIRAAMDGTPVATVWPPKAHDRVRLLVAPKP